MTAWVVIEMLKRSRQGSYHYVPEDPNNRRTPDEEKERVPNKKRARIAITVTTFFIFTFIASAILLIDSGALSINITASGNPNRPVIAADAPLGRYELTFADGWKPVSCEGGFGAGKNCSHRLCQPVDGRDIYRECTPTYKDLSP